MSSEPDLYPPEEQTEFEVLKRHGRKGRGAHRIRWGDEYKNWPVVQQRDYAEKLAATMNHAADVLQQERDRLHELATHQEDLLQQWQQKYSEAQYLIQKLTTDHNAREQGLKRELVEATTRLSQLEVSIHGHQH